MNNPKAKVPSSFSLSNKAWMYACLSPVFGLVPAFMVLIGDRSSQEVRDTSKVSILLALFWLAAVAMLGSPDRNGESLQMTTELIKGTFTSAYFVTSIYLMFRLYRGKNIRLPWLNRSKSP
jgi:small neutral amino acid transporter SnatA (MarC family)